MDIALGGTAADIIRFVDIVLAVVVVGAVLAVIRLHWRAWRAAPAGHGLVPLHVWLISTAHLCFVVGTATRLWQTLGESASWQIWLYMAGSAVTLAALWIIAKYQGRRVTETRQVEVAVTDAKSIKVVDGDVP